MNANATLAMSAVTAAPVSVDETAKSLCKIGREFYRRGWVLGTSGNFSARISDSPLRLAITASGLDKVSLVRSGILEIDGDATVLKGNGRTWKLGEVRSATVLMQLKKDATV